jgi:hypothetical protein
VTRLRPDVEDDVDALLKRYQQVVSAIHDELFTVVAIVRGEDVRGLARREAAGLIDRLGAFGNLNAAHDAVSDLFAGHEGVCRCLERRSSWD